VQTSGDLNIILGKSIEDYFSLDCAYIYYPIVKGVIPTLFYLGSYYYCVRQCIQKKRYKLFVLMLVLLIYAISETNAASLFSSFVLICSQCQNKNNKITVLREE